MDIEIKNESQALSICESAKSGKIRQLNDHISTLNTLINKINTGWSSTGSDKETYVKELQKQANNLKIISDQTYKFFDVISRYVKNTQNTSKKTVDSNASGGSGVVTGAVNTAGQVAVNNVKQVATNVDKVASGSVDTGKNWVPGKTVLPKYDNGISTGGVGTGVTSKPAIGGNRPAEFMTSNTQPPVGNEMVGTMHSDSKEISTNAVLGTHGTSDGKTSSVVSSGVSAKTAVAKKGGNVSSSNTGTIKSSTSGAVSTSASEIFNHDNSGGVLPKMSVPKISSDSGTSLIGKAVPVISGGVTAGAAGLAATTLFKKNSTVKPTKNLEIEAWEETAEVKPDNEATTMEQKLEELTFEDSIV